MGQTYRGERPYSVAEFLINIHGEHSGDIADHLVKGKQEARAIPYLVAAGEEAARAYALPVAIERMETAIAASGDQTDPSLVRQALETLGQAHEYLFDFEAAADAYQRLRAEGDRRNDAGMQVSGMNKVGLIRGFFFDERQEALDELAAAELKARGAEDGAGLVEACMNQCYLRTGFAELDEVEQYMKEVTALGRELGQEEPTLFGMSHFANTLALLTRFDEALAQGEEALAAAEEANNLHYQAELLTFVFPVCHLCNGDVEAAMAAVERGMEIAQRIGDHSSEAYAAVFQGKAAMVRGYFDEALALFRRVMAAADATGIPYAQAFGLCVTGTCYKQIGGEMIGRALEYHTRTLEMMELPTGTTLGAWLWAEIGHCALAAGKVEDAEVLFHKALTDQTMPMHLVRPSALLGEIEISLTEGRLDDASVAYATVEEYVTSREMRDYYAHLPYTAAQIAAACGDHDEALARLTEAEAIVTRDGM